MVKIMPVTKIKEYLDKENIKYVSIYHSSAYTAQETAECAHISGQEMAKVVVVKINDVYAMVVLPAPEHIDMELLEGAIDAGKVFLATEQEFDKLFPNCEVGAMPPFGNLYDMDVYIEEDITSDEKIAFNAGTHTELIEMAYEDFERLVQPFVLRFSAKYTKAVA